jgi:hypothetical protein
MAADSDLLSAVKPLGLPGHVPLGLPAVGFVPDRHLSGLGWCQTIA